MSLPPIQQFDAAASGPDRPETPGSGAKRVPNLGHAALFLVFAAMLFFLLQLALVMLGLSPVKQSGGQITVQHPMLQLAVLAATYAGTLAGAWLFFPLLWHRPFLEGLQWRWSAARPLAWRLLALGLLSGLTIAFLDQFIAQPTTAEIDQFFVTPLAAWEITLFGIFVAPVFEEIAFRGMLLPAFAIAVDWLRIPRTAESYANWQSGVGISNAAWFISAALTSALFVWLHAQQVGYAWGVLAALYCVSLFLTAVRLRLGSVAASAMVHAAYNGLIFLAALLATGGYRHLERMHR
ncbi:MAG TPA: CPBP family intramembrane glutamic endopeptidase [Acidobacteriaceae bacterium]